MKLQQIYTGCIAHAAYYLESKGEAAIFDPLREVQPYIDPRRGRWCQESSTCSRHTSMPTS
jgi:hypothetical protein